MIQYNHMLLVVNAQTAFAAPLINEAFIHAAGEMAQDGGKMLLKAAASYEAVHQTVVNINEAVDALRPHMMVGWTAQMPQSHAPRITNNAHTFGEWVQEAGDPALRLYDGDDAFGPLPEDMIFTSAHNDTSVFKSARPATGLRSDEVSPIKRFMDNNSISHLWLVGLHGLDLAYNDFSAVREPAGLIASKKLLPTMGLIGGAVYGALPTGSNDRPVILATHGEVSGLFAPKIGTLGHRRALARIEKLKLAKLAELAA